MLRVTGCQKQGQRRALNPLMHVCSYPAFSSGHGHTSPAATATEATSASAHAVSSTAPAAAARAPAAPCLRTPALRTGRALHQPQRGASRPRGDIHLRTVVRAPGRGFAQMRWLFSITDLVL